MPQPKIRLLRCNQCKTLDEIPDFEGRPEEDHLLASVIRTRHTEPNGQTHIGILMSVEKEHWDSPFMREQIIKRIAEESGHTGLEPGFYATRDTFSEDALKCFSKHHRNVRCNDYKSSGKRLSPGTAAERKAAGLPKYRSPHDRYLCEFCPVHTLVLESLRHKAGMYD